MNSVEYAQTFGTMKAELIKVRPELWMDITVTDGTILIRFRDSYGLCVPVVYYGEPLIIEKTDSPHDAMAKFNRALQLMGVS